MDLVEQIKTQSALCTTQQTCSMNQTGHGLATDEFADGLQNLMPLARVQTEQILRDAEYKA